MAVQEVGGDAILVNMLLAFETVRISIMSGSQHQQQHIQNKRGPTICVSFHW